MKKKAVKITSGVDYTTLTCLLRDRLKTRAPVTYQRGRERMSQQIITALGCTPARGRHIVSSLVERGLVRYRPHPDYQHDHTVGRWTYHPEA